MPYFSVEIYQEKSSLTERNSWLLVFFREELIKESHFSSLPKTINQPTVTPKAKFFIILWTTNQPTVTPEAKILYIFMVRLEM